MFRVAIYLYNIHNYSRSVLLLFSPHRPVDSPFSGNVTPGSTRQCRTHGAGKLNSLPQGLQPRKVSRTSSQDKHPRFHWREFLEADSASRHVPNSRAKNSTPCSTSNHRRSVNTCGALALWSSCSIFLQQHQMFDRRMYL